MKTRSILLVLFLALLCGCAPVPAQTAPTLLEPAGVQPDIATVGRQDVLVAQFSEAFVVPQTHLAYFSAEGTVLEVLVAVGDHVEKGQVLARLDVRQEEKELQRIRDEIAAQTALNEIDRQLLQLDIDEQTYLISEYRFQRPNDQDKQLPHMELELENRVRKLQQLKEQQETALRSLGTRLSPLQKAIESSALVAPASGQIVYFSGLKNGELAPSLVPIIAIADDSQLHLKGDFISAGTLSTAKELRALIDGSEIPVQPLEYDMDEYISMVLSGQEMETAFSLPNGGEGFSVGQYATIILIEQSSPNALSLPSNAIYRDASGSYVYKKQGDDRLRQSIRTGVRGEAYTEILEGLQEGDEVYVRQ